MDSQSQLPDSQGSTSTEERRTNNLQASLLFEYNDSYRTYFVLVDKLAEDVSLLEYVRTFLDDPTKEILIYIGKKTLHGETSHDID